MLQLTLRVSRAEFELVEGLLLEQGAVSVTLKDAGNEPIYEPSPGELSLWTSFEVLALFEPDRDMERVRTSLGRALDRSPGIHVAPLEERDWVRAWMDDFGPMDFGNGLWVCPAGTSPPEDAATLVQLDPGLAFGTGTHATTALCLEWLASHPPRGARVVDYGCGSGILSLAAAQLGARQVTAVDIDPQALQATRDNATKNGIPDGVVKVGAPGRVEVDPADVILANILSNTLVDLYPVMLELSRAGTRIVLSGILAEQVETVSGIYSRGFRLLAPRCREEWALIEGVRTVNLPRPAH